MSKHIIKENVQMFMSHNDKLRTFIKNWQNYTIANTLHIVGT